MPISKVGGAGQTAEVNFGTYHHTTRAESEAIRKFAKDTFSKLVRPLYPSDAALRILTLAADWVS
jgi:hypothetical protein